MPKKMLMPLRRIHGKIDNYVTDKNMMLKGYNNSKKISKNQEILNEDYPVDFVVLWVDGSDPEWLAEKSKYQNNDDMIKKYNTAARFREWDNFNYWFRSVEQYAPWVRYVYLVTWGHTPAWLNKEHRKLKIIKHQDFIPQKYLPTFSCNPIQLNLWRIEGLSEHYVCFDDDIFITKPLNKSDFFYNGLPKECAIAKPEYPRVNMDTWEHQLFNVAGVINSSFDIKKSIAKNPEKWFSYKYGNYLKYNVRAYEDNKIVGMYYTHLAGPSRKSVCKEVWDEIGEQLDKTCMNRFRTMSDLILQVFRLWNIFKGDFEPVERDYYGYAANITPDNFDYFKKCILSDNYKMICVNDSDYLKEENFDQLKNQLLKVFETKYLEKSSFEL